MEREIRCWISWPLERNRIQRRTANSFLGSKVGYFQLSLHFILVIIKKGNNTGNKERE